MAALQFETDSKTIDHVTISLIAELLVEVKTLRQQVNGLEMRAMIAEDPSTKDITEHVHQLVAETDSLTEHAIDQVNKRIAELNENYLNQLDRN